MTPNEKACARLEIVICELKHGGNPFIALSLNRYSTIHHGLVAFNSVIFTVPGIDRIRRIVESYGWELSNDEK